MRHALPDTDRHALVVGAGRGIGLALVRALLADTRYARVAAAARGTSAEWKALADAHGARFAALMLDVSEEASVAQAAVRVASASPRLHLLINCAGVLHDTGLRPERRLADVVPEAVLRGFAVNTLGPLLLAKHFAPLLAHAEPAVFASLSARVGSIGDNRLGGWYAYRAAKAAQNQVVRTVAIELARKAPGLICVALHPGTVDTALSKPFQAGVAAEKLFTPERAAAHLLAVIEGLTPAQTGGFFAWDGGVIPW